MRAELGSEDGGPSYAKATEGRQRADQPGLVIQTIFHTLVRYGGKEHKEI